MSELQLTGLYKGYAHQPVLKGVDLEVPSGSLTAVLGLSGCGKTTLLRLIAGFARPERGTVALGGRTLADHESFVPPEKRGIGYVPQEGALFPHLTAAANVGFGLPRSERRGPVVTEMLELVGLSSLGKRYPHELSGGEQQRVALARALARGPELLLLDEPFSSLDAALRVQMREEIHTLLRSRGVTTVMVTHDQEEALSLADTVAILREGTIVQKGTPHELYTRPYDTELAQFLGSANLIEAIFKDGVAQTALGPLALRSGQSPSTDAGVVLLRPEQIAVIVGEQAPIGASERGVAGAVEQCRYYGHDALLQIRTESSNSQLLLARVDGEDALPVGAPVFISAHGSVTVVPGNGCSTEDPPPPSDQVR